MARTTIAAGKVNVDTIVRKIIGCPKDIPYASLAHDMKLKYNNVANVFRRTNSAGGTRGTGYKTGAGMKLIEKFVLEQQA